jgi:integrase
MVVDTAGLTLGQLVELFLRSLSADVRAGRNKKNTWVGYELQLRHCLERLGKDRPIEGLRRIDLLEHVRSWHEIQAMQRLFKWAEDEEPPLAQHNPARKLKKPPPGQRTRVFTRREKVMLRRRARRPIRDFLTMMDESIARPQECRPMGWHHIREDWLAFILTEFKAKKRRQDGLAVRVIPITPRLSRLLRRLRRRGEKDFGEWLDSQGQPIPISPRRAAKLERLRRGVGHFPEILLGAKGQPLETGPVCRAIRLLRKKLGMDKGEKIVSYTMRHTGATTAVRNGLRDARLANLIGHASPRTTERYLHLDAGDAIADMKIAKLKR